MQRRLPANHRLRTAKVRDTVGVFKEPIIKRKSIGKRLSGIIGAIVCSLLSSPAQGVFINSNRATAQGLDAPFYQIDGATGLDSNYVAQIWAGSESGNLAPISNPAPFRDGSGAGYWNAPVADRTEGVAVPGVAPGESAFVQIFAWNIAFESLEAAIASCDAYTTSLFSAVTGALGSVGPPPVPAAPAPLLGMTSAYHVCIPEPRTIALATVGALLIGLRTRCGRSRNETLESK